MGFESNLTPVPEGINVSKLITKDTRRIGSRAHYSMVLLVAAGISLFGYWSSVTELDIVTRGSGQVVPRLQNQFVQHLEGGIINQILVSEGQIVSAGDVIMRITDEFSEAEFRSASQELLAARANLERLNAETLGQERVFFPKDLMERGSKEAKDQSVLFDRRKANVEQRILVLQDQIRRKELEKREKEAKLQNTQLEFALMNKRVESLGALVRSGAASENELLESQLNLQRIRTRMSDLTYQIPQTEVDISEAIQRQKEIRYEFIANANEEKIQTLNRISRLEATIEALEDREDRTEVRAPIDGKVHRLFQTTVGGVVQGGQNLVQLVPIDETVSIEIEVAPKDRGRIWIDLPAIVKLSAYDFSTYGGINAKVTNISSDTLTNEQGQPFYRVNLEADLSDFGGREIVPGMAAEVDIITGKRLIIEYLFAPIEGIRSKAMREP